MHLKSEARLFLESSQHYNQVQSTLKTINSTSSPKEQCRDNSIISILRAANGLTLVQDGKGSAQRQRCFAGNIPDLRLTHVISMSHADQLFPCKLITNMSKACQKLWKVPHDYLMPCSYIMSRPNRDYLMPCSCQDETVSCQAMTM